MKEINNVYESLADTDLDVEKCHYSLVVSDIMELIDLRNQYICNFDCNSIITKALPVIFDDAYDYLIYNRKDNKTYEVEICGVSGQAFIYLQYKTALSSKLLGQIIHFDVLYDIISDTLKDKEIINLDE